MIFLLMMNFEINDLINISRAAKKLCKTHLKSKLKMQTLNRHLLHLLWKNLKEIAFLIMRLKMNVHEAIKLRVLTRYLIISSNLTISKKDLMSKLQEATKVQMTWALLQAKTKMILMELNGVLKQADQSNSLACVSVSPYF